ncbi:integrator complex subunit 7-like [Corticium candelabrum]|uniref:integrator complex subunit 7-like n=1 Tax=Corticium candelabrum TaxID=121492 RepID=UPI002E2624C2|nr:integrator complex subunit 7-like [Corticium candelabrum]
MSLQSDSLSQDVRQKANTTLMELDKGLRSKIVGEQCESILRFEGLFDRFPFPIVINSAYLKLSDVFREGTNFLRLWVWKVTQRCACHLEKIMNVDEVVKRLFSVTHSNDPVARALTLRMFGSMAYVVSERKNVHQCVLSSLKTHDKIELEAAVFATSKLCKTSGTFAASVCDEIAEMIQGLATPVPVKLKLLPIFQNMYHSAETATRVRQLCISLLASHPAQDFVLIALETLTKLAAAAFLGTIPQIELLLDYMKRDPRILIKRKALRDLDMLAQKSPHLWNKQHIIELWEAVHDATDDNLQVFGFIVMNTLAHSVAVLHLQKDDQIWSSVDELCYHTNPSIASLSCGIFCCLSTNETNDNQRDELASALQSALLLCATSPVLDSRLKPLKLVLSSIVKVARMWPDLTAQFSQLLADVLTSCKLDINLLIVRCLNVLSGINCEGVRKSLPVVDLTKVVETAQKTGAENTSEIMVLVVALLLRMNQMEYQSQAKFTESLQAWFDSQIVAVNAWGAYRLAREAAQQGYHELATHIFNKLTNKVASVRFIYWLRGITRVCTAENMLLKPTTLQCLKKVLPEAIGAIYEGVTEIKASSSSIKQMVFQSRYCSLRGDLLRAHDQLLASCTSLFTCPPPAIAATGDKSDFSHQMEVCVETFQRVASDYQTLCESLFDADSNTLNNVLSLQHSCSLMAQLIELVILREVPLMSPSLFGVSSSGFDDKTEEIHDLKVDNMLLKRCHQVAKKIQLELPALQASSVGSKHVKMLSQASRSLIQVPFCLPPYFFQSPQSTQIMLALSPTSANVGEPVIVAHNHDCLTLNVEGFLRHKGTAGHYRHVKSVHLVVQTKARDNTPRSSTSVLLDKPHMSPVSPPLEKVVHPSNDFFTTSFLIAMPHYGRYDVTVKVSVIDDEGRQWKTGPWESLLIHKETPVPGTLSKVRRT